MTTSLLAAWLWTFLLHSSALLVGVWALMRLLPRLSLPAQERLWWTAALGGVLTATLAVATPLGSSTPVLPLLPAETERVIAERSTASPTAPSNLVAYPAAAPAFVYPELTGAEFARGSSARHPRGAGSRPPELARAAPAAEQLQEPSRGVVAPTAKDPAGPTSGWPLWIGALWALGLAFATYRMWRDERGLRRALRDRRAVTAPTLHGALRRLLVRARIPAARVSLTSARALASPVAWGTWRQEICIPERALEELPPAERDVMLAHEVAHLRRHDGLALRVRRTLLALFFFQPLLRVADRRLHHIAELRCDDWAAEVTGERAALAACLARVAGWLVGEPRALAVPAMACRHGTLEHRVGRLLSAAPRPGRHASGWPLAIALLAGSALCLPSVGMAEDPKDDPAAPEQGAQPPYLGKNFTLEAIADSWDQPEVFFIPGEFQGPDSDAQALTEALDALDRELEELVALMQPLEAHPSLAPALARLNARARSLRERRAAWLADLNAQETSR